MPRHYYRNNNDWKQRNSNNSIREGMVGLFFTVDGDPARALKEARRLLDEFVVEEKQPKPDEATEEKGSIKPTTSEGEIDISDALASSCGSDNTKSGIEGDRWPRDKWRQEGIEVQNKTDTFKLMDTSVKNTIFFKVPSKYGDVYKLADKLVIEGQANNRCRFLARVIPVDRIVRAFKESVDSDLSKYISEKISEYIVANAGKEASAAPPSYAVDFSHRNSDMMKRQDVFDLVAGVFQRDSPSSQVSLGEPTLLFIVQLIRSFVLLSCVDGVRYIKDTRRFSLRSPTEQASDAYKKEEGEQSGTENHGKIEE